MSVPDISCLVDTPYIFLSVLHDSAAEGIDNFVCVPFDLTVS